MRIPSPEPSLSSWREYKERGKAQFSSERYEEALASYRAALNPEFNCPAMERQVLLSNVVACRLKIGGQEMASAAVEEAKQCIALNERWAKGHVRLASAYIALGGHSNDACNALQRALALDPSNTTARQMLLRELRRDRAQRASENSGNDSRSRFGPSATPADDLGGNEDASAPSSAANPSYGATPSAPPPDDYMGSQAANTSARANNVAPPFQDNIDESPTLTERFQFYLARVSTWYERELSDDMRTLLKVMLGLLVLYVAFGGRFGLDGLLGGDKGNNRGNYDYGNAYDKYYSRSNTGAENSGSSSGYNDHTTRRYSSDSYSQSGRRTMHDDYTPPRSSRRGSSTSYHAPNLFDGSLPSLIILGAFAFTCHHFGINPFHAIWMLNIFTGNRGRGMGRMGMMGMGYGMMHNQMRFGRRGMRRGG